jgi:hypothetical protein
MLPLDGESQICDKGHGNGQTPTTEEPEMSKTQMTTDEAARTVTAVEALVALVQPDVYSDAHGGINSGRRMGLLAPLARRVIWAAVEEICSDEHLLELDAHRIVDGIERDLDATAADAAAVAAMASVANPEWRRISAAFLRAARRDDAPPADMRPGAVSHAIAGYVRMMGVA